MSKPAARKVQYSIARLRRLLSANPRATNAALGRQLGLTRERVRQLIDADVALRRVRRAGGGGVRRRFPFVPDVVNGGWPSHHETERAGDDLMVHLGFDVIPFSQMLTGRHNAPVGLPDRYYVHRVRRVAVWWEVKQTTEPSVPKAQAEFRRMCRDAGLPYVIGDVSDLMAWLLIVGIDPKRAARRRGLLFA